MDENLKVDKDFKEAFNQGYELAKELKLTAPMFKNVNFNDNQRMSAIYSGMKQYATETAMENNKWVTRCLDLNENNQMKRKDSGKGFGLST